MTKDNKKDVLKKDEGNVMDRFKKYICSLIMDINSKETLERIYRFIVLAERKK